MFTSIKYSIIWTFHGSLCEKINSVYVRENMSQTLILLLWWLKSQQWWDVSYFQMNCICGRTLISVINCFILMTFSSRLICVWPFGCCLQSGAKMCRCCRDDRFYNPRYVKDACRRGRSPISIIISANGDVGVSFQSRYRPHHRLTRGIGLVCETWLRIQTTRCRLLAPHVWKQYFLIYFVHWQTC